MAKKKIVSRNYNFADAYLKQIADNMSILLDRDIVEFTDMGLTPAKQNDFTQKIQDFANFPSDEQLEGIKVNATQTKNTNRNNLEKIMRTILLIAKLVFKEGSGKYKEFGNANLTQQTDEELVRNATMMGVSANKYLNDLINDGLSLAKIQQLDVAKKAFDDAIDAQRKAISERDSTTEKRVEMGNQLYELVVKYAEIGKNIWYDTNEAKYNDYIIYDTPPTQPDPVS